MPRDLPHRHDLRLVTKSSMLQLARSGPSRSTAEYPFIGGTADSVARDAEVFTKSGFSEADRARLRRCGYPRREHRITLPPNLQQTSATESGVLRTRYARSEDSSF